MKNFCLEPKSFAVEAETDKGKEFVTTKLMTRQTYTLAFMEGAMDTNPITFSEEDGMDFAATTVQLPDGERVPFLFTCKQLLAKGEGSDTLAFMEGAMDTNPITFSEEDGMDFAATTVQLPDGERVPFLFTCKQLLAKGEGSEFKPGFTWGGEFNVPSYRTGGFLDPKGRGMYLGYDQAVALPASQADGKEGQDELFKESNKVFDIGKGAIEMEVNKVNEDLGEIGGVFVSKQPGDTDMGAKTPKTILLKGIFYGKIV
eukprot:CAMPEP_0172927694 /NCGR_PEP_ID=MMETSP1075-20121228/217597_1 /TAXON_ID=2916 /ORGANISM="Ceratium fusus, Strain PA161109" /LENGTH=257 /DNA_ID=CAMNT_0013788963 /DNA_START=476 /DNA_END=1250 /DNA_ORIENTATION=-